MGLMLLEGNLKHSLTALLCQRRSRGRRFSPYNLAAGTSLLLSGKLNITHLQSLIEYLTYAKATSETAMTEQASAAKNKLRGVTIRDLCTPACLCSSFLRLSQPLS
eukprot:2295854-Amphidinium_carterae.2